MSTTVNNNSNSPRMYDRNFLLRYQNHKKADSNIQAISLQHINDNSNTTNRQNSKNVSKTPNPKAQEKAKVVYQPKTERKIDPATLSSNSQEFKPYNFAAAINAEGGSPLKNSYSKEGSTSALSASSPSSKTANYYASPTASPLSTPSHSSPKIISPFKTNPNIRTSSPISKQTPSHTSSSSLTTLYHPIQPTSPLRGSPNKVIPRTPKGTVAASRTPPISPRVNQVKHQSPSSSGSRSGYSSPHHRVMRPISPLDSVRLNQRQKQIDYGYKTVGYLRYRLFVPKDQRKPEHPRTPKKSQACSKRSWDGQLKKWRRDLHLWDPTNMEAFKALLSSELVDNIVQQNPDLAEIVKAVRDKLNNPINEDLDPTSESETDDENGYDDLDNEDEATESNPEPEHPSTSEKKGEAKRVARALVY